ncbi:MAG: helix-turn-helix transcriptional regulator [Phycisphaeraceae bacterium]
MTKSAIRMTIGERRYVAIPEEEWAQTLARAAGVELPAYPPRGKHGYPAVTTSRVSIAREIISRRLAAGWTQDDLARRAGMRVETVSRLESAKHAPQAATVQRIDAAFKKAGV